MVPLSLNVTYYNEPHFLKWWYQTSIELSGEGMPITLNIADDGSARLPAEDFFNKNQPTQYMRLFKVTEDIGFNSHGCRNLLMRETETEWNLMSDIDREYPKQTFERLVKTDLLKKGTYYCFQDHRDQKKWSLNDYAVHKEDFWTTGGYDEEFVNIHTGDRIFLDNLKKHVGQAKHGSLKIRHVRHARDVSINDKLKTTQYPDDDTLIIPKTVWHDKEVREMLLSFVRARNEKKQLRFTKPVVRFPWVRVF